MKRIFSTLVLGLALMGALQAQELTNFAFWGNQKPIVSPEIQNDSVTFRLKADYATIVKLSGSWMPNPWGGTIDMTRSRSGNLHLQFRSGRSGRERPSERSGAA